MGLVRGEFRGGLASWFQNLIALQFNKKILNFRKFCTPISVILHRRDVDDTFYFYQKDKVDSRGRTELGVVILFSFSSLRGRDPFMSTLLSLF
jgi:hypothetical protein